MKTSFYLLITFLLAQPCLSQEHLKVNTEKSKIHWFGEYAFYFGGHDGTIDFKEGYFIKKTESLVGGTFIIDMNSISSTDMDTKDAREGLDNHLKNEDFFEVETYPTATLKITSISYETPERIKVIADLTIKDVTRSINFWADLDYDKQQMSTKFKIDRTLWGITFNSKEVEGKLKDGLISDAIGFDVLISL